MQFAGFMGVGMIIMMIFGVITAVGKEKVISLDTIFPFPILILFFYLSIIVTIDTVYRFIYQNFLLL